MSHYPTRQLHLVDIENLVGTARPSRHQASACRTRYAELSPLGLEDQLVLACNHGAALDVGCEWPGARLLLGSGPDGADLALLGVLNDERIERRFTRLVIASGDSIFAEAVCKLSGLGLEVTVVSRPEALSKRLRLAASRVIHFVTDLPPAPPTRVGVAA